MGSGSEERAVKGATSADKRTRQRGAPSVGVGREELRAAVLKPYLLRLRAERGEGAARALLASVGIPAGVLEDETGWISIGAAQRALNALATALGGEQAIARRGDWMTHPETLGAYVRMLRVASEPVDAYRYLTANYAESTRVGSYELSVFGRGRLQIVYRPRRDVEARQDDPLLCLARRAEFASVPRLWGLDEARVDDIACIVRGDECCKYAVRWRPSRRRQLPLGALAGGLVCAASVALSGSFVAAGIALVVGAALGSIVGLLSERVAEERAARSFEKNRIMALERGLELRGQLGVSPGDLTGAVLGGKYRILRKIGSGGIGAVYEAEHVALGSHVAVKVLRGAAAADAAEIARLRREARVQVSIEHSNVVRTLDLDQMPDGSIFVVMELLHGSSVAERLRASGPLAPGFAIPVFMQVCRALEAAHKLGIVHRDLKPGNVFVCEDRSVKVLDFGMSKFAEAESLTQEGYTLGTPEYMSPEQCIGAPVEPRTDLYAFGVLMYEALTGEIPIRGRNRRELLDLHQRAMPTPMRERRPDLKIPPELESVVLECLAKRLEDRPPGASAVERLLAAVPAEGLIHEYPPGTSRKAPAARRSAG